MRTSVLRASSYLLAGGLWTTAFATAASVFLARRLAPADYGLLQWLLWVQQGLSLLALSGLPLAIQKHAYRSPRPFLKDALCLGALVWTILALVLLGVRVLAPGRFPLGIQPIWMAIALAGSGILIPRTLAVSACVASDQAGGLWRGYLWTAPSSLLLLVAGTVRGVPGVLAAMALGAILETILFGRLALSSPASLPGLLDGERAAFWRSFRWLSAATILDLFTWQRVEVFLLGLWSRSEQVAYYSLASSLSVQGVGLCAGAAASALLPRLSQAASEGDVEGARSLFRASFAALALVALPLASGLAFLSEPVLRAAYPRLCAGAAPLLPWLAWGGANTALMAMVATFLNSRDHTPFLLAASAVQAILKLGCGFWLLPRFHAQGAAWMNTGVHLLSFLAYAVGVQRLCKVAYPWTRLGLTVACAILPALAFRGLMAGRPVAWQCLTLFTAYPLLYLACIKVLGLLNLKEAQ